MPYRGTNAKRQVIHDKSRGTLRESARDHYLGEKKEHEHELANAKEKITKYFNDGYRFSRREELEKSIRITFANASNDEKHIDFQFPDNFDALKAFIENPRTH